MKEYRLTEINLVSGHLHLTLDNDFTLSLPVGSERPDVNTSLALKLQRGDILHLQGKRGDSTTELIIPEHLDRMYLENRDGSLSQIYKDTCSENSVSR